MSRTHTQQTVDDVLRNPAIWRAQQLAHGQAVHGKPPGIATEYPALDQALPDGGWPVGVLTELLVRETGTGELSLLMPALRAICAQGRGIALFAPPYLPHARAWQAAGIPLERMLAVDATGTDLLWAAEQALRSGDCGAVVIWGQAAGRALNYRALQRLHLAASTGNAACFAYRAAGAETSPSPAPLRLRLAAHAGGLRIQLVKSRGAASARPVPVQTFPAHWQAGNSHKSHAARFAPPGTAAQPMITARISSVAAPASVAPASVAPASVAPASVAPASSVHVHTPVV